VSYPYNQREHDEATNVSGVLLLLAFVPFVLALIGAIWSQVIS